jgi:hypothetical protein
MENKVFEVFGDFEDFGGMGGLNVDESSVLPHVWRNKNDVGVTQEHIRHERVWNEVPTVDSESESLWLDIGSNDDEGDEEDIGEWNSMKYL